VWLRPWECQLTGPDGETLIDSTGWVNLNGTLDTDPYARLIEAQLGPAANHVRPEQRKPATVHPDHPCAAGSAVRCSECAGSYP